MRNKKLLLDLSEKIARLSSQEAISQVLNLIYSVEEESGNKEELIKYLFVAYKNIYVLGGFKSAQNSFINLIDNVLIIKKNNNKIEMCNKEYNSLEFDEFKYVMSWARRICITKKNNKPQQNNYNLKKVNVKENKNYIKCKEDDSPFAVLKNYKFK